MRIRAFLAVSLLLLLTSCQSVQKRQPTGLTGNRFLQMQRDRHKSFEKISAKLSMRYDGIKDSVSGKGRLLAGGEERYRLEIRDPLGRLHYLAALSGANFQAQYPRQSRAFVDQQGGKGYLRKVAGIGMDFKSLCELAVGIIPAAWSKKSFDKWEWDDSAGIYRGNSKVGSADVEIEVDGATGSINSLVVKDPATIAEVRYSDLEPCCGGSEIQQSLARVAEVRWPQSKASFEFEWDDVKVLGQSPKDAAFQPALEESWKVIRF